MKRNARRSDATALPWGEKYRKMRGTRIMGALNAINVGYKYPQMSNASDSAVVPRDPKYCFNIIKMPETKIMGALKTISAGNKNTHIITMDWTKRWSRLNTTDVQ